MMLFEQESHWTLAMENIKKKICTLYNSIVLTAFLTYVEYTFQFIYPSHNTTLKDKYTWHIGMFRIVEWGIGVDEI